MSTTTMSRIIRQDGIASDWCGSHIRFPESESEFPESESESDSKSEFRESGFPDDDELDAEEDESYSELDSDINQFDSDINQFRFVIETLNMSNIPKSHRDTIEDILFSFYSRGNRYCNEYTELSHRAHLASSGYYRGYPI